VGVGFSAGVFSFCLGLTDAQLRDFGALRVLNRTLGNAGGEVLEIAALTLQADQTTLDVCADVANIGVDAFTNQATSELVQTLCYVACSSAFTDSVVIVFQHGVSAGGVCLSAGTHVEGYVEVLLD
jgi:hypothetical protein